jgi:5'-nucleotidase
MLGKYVDDEPASEGTDRWALRHNYVAITPTTMDVTAYGSMDAIKEWNL